MVAQLGEALAPRQLLVTGASFLTWFAIQRVATGPLLSLLFGEKLWATRDAEQRHRCSISLTSCLFALVVVAIGVGGLCFPSAGVVVDPIYGESALIQFGAAVVVGFFAWNIVAENLNGWAGWPNLVHHACCLISFVFVQHPFSPVIACGLMLFEASTPPLATFKILQNLGLESTPLYRIARVLFAVLFFVFRLALGVPLTIRWYLDMYELAHDPHRQVHSATIFYVSLILPVPFMMVNFFWFWLIARNACLKNRKGR